VCENGQIRYKIESEPSHKVIERNAPKDEVSPYQRESENFIESVRTGKEPLTGVEDGVATVRISHAVLQSSQSGGTVMLDT
jgi:predicted dehydrogenase